ncbi:DNA polymerase III subunit gamma and tau [Carbonactinospora thermoautotrophica]|uniref:DNA polymerase III subunit gamma and tau n=1 Tax=Carbonactinospora thermoautotrophica TaxID=1469144 RepID=UPI003DAA4696
MSLALYRRYRPETFEEVVGQEHVTVPLQQALRNDRVHHAYLFSGPRGCGKTTSARILARCLNCERGPTPTPCGECRSCRDLARNGPGSIDVIEIDAASHGGVDDARELRERAHFAPAQSRYKIYIVDEAHMVTSAGFNALLKLVEEPPEHVKFIFATTEPDKVIGTIRSRTHHYPFRLVPPGVVRDYLAELCEKEGVTVEDGVLPLVVRAGGGSMRDTLSVLDQLIAGSGPEGVTYQLATALLGYTDDQLLDDIVNAFAARDGAAVFQVVDRVIEGGHDPRRFVADLLERFRDLVILAAVPDAAGKGLIDKPADQLDRMRDQAARFGLAELSRAADLINAGLAEMRGATAPRLQLELLCARVLLPAADDGSVLARLERLERRLSTGGAPPAVAAQHPPAAQLARQQAEPGGHPVSHQPAGWPPEDEPAGRLATRLTGQRAAGQLAGPATAEPPGRRPPSRRGRQRLTRPPGQAARRLRRRRPHGRVRRGPGAGRPRTGRPPLVTGKPPCPPGPRRWMSPRSRQRSRAVWTPCRYGGCGRRSWRRSSTGAGSPGSCSARTPRSPGWTAPASRSPSSTRAPGTAS